MAVAPSNVRNIAQLRRERGLTQSQLADKMGVKCQYVQRIESGSINIENITLKNAVNLAGALEIGVEELYHGWQIHNDGEEQGQ